MQRRAINALLGVLAVLVILFAIWGPELIALYRDKATFNKITAEIVEEENEGYRYVLDSNEKMYILSRCLNNQILPETELNALTRLEVEGVDYEEITGTYAFVVNRQGPSGKEIADSEIFTICNKEIEKLKELGIMPKRVRKVDAASYTAVLYSAIDVLEPRNNMSVWKVSLSTSKETANKSNRLLDAYIDADSGKIYEFFVRTQGEWEDIQPDQVMEQWSEYLGLTGMEEYETENPLLETTPYFAKYRFPGRDDGSTVVTIGFYDGINELFLKISR